MSVLVPMGGKTIRVTSRFCTMVGLILILNASLTFSTEAEESGVIIERNHPTPIRDTASKPYAVVVDANTLKHPEWGQVVEALKKKYNAKVFIAHYPEVGTVRKELNEYMPWYVCFVAQPEQATREMITAAAYTMTWLDDDLYEDAIWAVLTGFAAEDALRIVNAEPLVVRKELSNLWDGWLDWLEEGVSLSSDSNYKFVKNIGGVKQQLKRPKEITAEFVEVLNQDDCDMVMTSAHGSEHAFYLGYPNTATDGYITHNEKGDIYGVDTLGKVHPVNTNQIKIYYAPGNCNIGHIDGKSCYSLAWIHNGTNALYGRLYTYGRAYGYSLGEYFMALQGRYTFAEAAYVEWLMSRFSEDKLLELHPCWDRIHRTAVLYGDPAWEARVKHTTVPAYTQDLNIEHLSDGLIKMTVSITVRNKLDRFNAWQPAVRPVVLLPFRIQDVQVKHTDLDKMDVADNFIVLDLGTPSIGRSDLPVGTKKSVVLYARELEAWPFLSDDEVNTRMKEWSLDNVSRCFDFLTDETVDPNERIKKAAKWHMPRILAKEADVNSKDEDGRTPLHLAVESANKVIIEFLLGKGANINAKDKDGQTPLHFAARDGYKDIVELLIEKGADIKAKNNNGESPLSLAALNGQVDIVEMLLVKGADFLDSIVQDDTGRTPLGLAAEKGNTKVVELIRKLANQSGYNKEIMTIHDYAAIGDTEKVKSLISGGINVNAKNKNGGTALFVATYNEHIELVELLIQNSADVNIQSHSGVTPLIIACNKGNKDIAELLLEKGADFNVKTNQGKTPLAIAKERGNTEIVELLKKHGAK